MIISFADTETRTIFEGERSRRLPQDIQVRARRKLIQIYEATIIDDLRIPPGNRLEQLQGDRVGQWSIRINQQWRVCFVWNDDNHADRVEIVDYH